MKIKIELYGRLKHVMGGDEIVFETHSQTIKALYHELCSHFQTTDESQIIIPIINDTFCDWDSSFDSNDVIGFLPPASGG